MKRSRLLMALLAIFFAAEAHAAEFDTEIGEINSAQFRIDIPKGWKGSLILYAHGYALGPTRFQDAPASSLIESLVDQGFAVAQSGYAGTGWALEEGAADSQALRRYFMAKYGKPTETFVVGHSLGGLLAVMMLERFPGQYDGGLALCGPLASASWFLSRRAFDLRVVFDYYFPGVFPPPDSSPPGYSAELLKVIKQIEAAPEKAEAVRQFSGIRTKADLANTLVLYTYILINTIRRSGANPFDNRNVLYQGTPDDNELNKNIHRYTAAPGAAKYLDAYYTPTGRLSAPLLALAPTYDPVIPAWVSNSYATAVAQAGTTQLFEQKFVAGDAHCAVPIESVSDGLKTLRQWSKR